MKTTSIKNLVLQNFRIHQNFSCDLKNSNIILLGNNGSGKTSILEAISLLSPGKGMLSAPPIDLNYSKIEKSNITIEFDDSTVINIENKIGKTNIKTIKINEKTINKQVELTNWCDIIWFTSDTQYTFLLSSGNRRKFIDRIVFGFFNTHAGLLTDYDKLLKERIKVLLLVGNNGKWLDAIEKQISVFGAKIAHNRASIISTFNEKSAENSLLDIKLTTDGILENWSINENSIEEVTNKFADILIKNRKKDTESGRNSFGIHRSDFDILHKEESLQMVSSGRQKMFLLSVFELFAKLITDKNQRTPIILFDEISSFVDHNNFDKILSSFTKNHSQIWMASPRKYDLFDKYNTQIITM